jgi:hypothetical protein
LKFYSEERIIQEAHQLKGHIFEGKAALKLGQPEL